MRKISEILGKQTESKQFVTVAFRKFPDGTVIALFPSEVEGNGMILSYQHIGQHSSASESLVNELEPAALNEYADLQRELEKMGYAFKAII